MDKVLTVLNMLHDENYDPEYTSPNTVGWYAYENKIKLSSEEIVMISNVYGEKNDPTGRQDE